MNNMARYNGLSFSDIILARLKELGWSKSDLARRLQVTPARIRALLKQESMTETVFKKCSTVLGMSIIMTETSRPMPPEIPKKARYGMLVGGDLM